MVWDMNAAVRSLEKNDPTLSCKLYHDVKFIGASSGWLVNFPLRDSLFGSNIFFSQNLVCVVVKCDFSEISINISTTLTDYFAFICLYLLLLHVYCASYLCFL